MKDFGTSLDWSLHRLGSEIASITQLIGSPVVSDQFSRSLQQFDGFPICMFDSRFACSLVSRDGWRFVHLRAICLVRLPLNASNIRLASLVFVMARASSVEPVECFLGIRDLAQLGLHA